MKPALKLLVVLCFVLSSFLFSAPQALAQQTAGLGMEPLTATNYHAPQNTNYSFLNIVHSLYCLFAGMSEQPSQKCVSYDQNGSTNLYAYTPDGGVLGSLNHVTVAMLSTPPISEGEYMAYVGSHLGLVQPAYAQVNPNSQGGGVLSPILKMWELARNLAYLAFIIVFIVVGFMIMFRQRINPQTVVSVQSALPGLVVGLILVTFSYFISAFIVDLAFVGVQLVALIFTSSHLISNGDPSALATNGNFFNMLGLFLSNSGFGNNLIGPIKDGVQSLFGFDARGLLANPGNIIFNAGFFLSFMGGSVIGVVVTLILIVAIVIQLIKLIWQLVSSYITIMVITILAPLIILMSSLPGRGGGLSGWWKTLIANVLVFPAVFAGFLFALAILGVSDGSFSHPLPLFYSFPTTMVRGLLGYGIILALPGIPKALKEALKVQDNPLGAVAGAGAAAGFARVSGAAGLGAQRATAGLRAQREAYQRALNQNKVGVSIAPKPPSSGNVGPVPLRGKLLDWYMNRPS